MISLARTLVAVFLALAIVALPVTAQSQDEDPTKAAPQSPAGEAPEGQPKAETAPGVMGARWPSASPDGKQLAFSLWGDIWVVPATGGRAVRLTLNEANDVRPTWSPDGKRIAFTSDRSGSWDVWAMPADGGTPVRITHDAALETVNQYSPDGRWVYFQSNRTGEWRIYRIPADGGTAEPVTLDVGTNASVLAGDPERIYYSDGVSDAKIKGYRGSANDELFVCTPGAVPERLTRNDQNDRDPHVTSDGKTLYFIRETGKSGKDYNLFSRDLATGEEKALTSLDENGMSHLDVNADGTKIHFVWKFRIHTIDLTSEKREPQLVPIEVIEDARRDPVTERTMMSGAESVDLSPDRKKIALEISGSIWLMDAEGGRATPLTPDGSGDHMPRFSPDSKKIAFYSSRKGNDDLYVMDADGSDLRQITFSPEGEHFHNWAPDGRWLVYSADRGKHRNLWRVNADGSNPLQLTQAQFNCDDPSVSPDGKWIAFDSWAKGNADIYVMPAGGGQARFVYGTLAQEESPRWSPDGRLLVFTRTSSTGTAVTRQVVVTDLQGSGEVMIGDGRDGSFTPDGRDIVYADGRGLVKLAPAPTDVFGGRTIPFIATRKVALPDEFKRVYEEAYKRILEAFYDPKFHGVDMKSLHKRYQPLVHQSRTRLEFYAYLNELVGELKASHQGVGGPVTDTPSFSTGLLGCELFPEIVPLKAGEDEKAPRMLALRVVQPGKGGPADKAWIRHGDYIFGVGEHRLKAGDDFYQKLEGTAGKNVNLLVGTKPDGSDLRTVTLVPEDLNAQRGREYKLWVERNKTLTQQLSGGQVSYIHIPAMNGGSLREFENELGSKDEQGRKALILDVRNNGGGNIHQQLIDILSRRHYADNWTQKGEPGKSPNLYWERPVVLLINTRSYSDAEVFPHAFKTLGMGTIVGEATPGAVIGTNDVTLSDGTQLRLTTFGFKGLDGKNLEGNGCQPDVVVELTAKDRVEGNDPQLRKAIEIALEKIAPRKAEPPAQAPAIETPGSGGTPGQPAAAPGGQPVPPPDGKPGDAPTDKPVGTPPDQPKDDPVTPPEGTPTGTPDGKPKPGDAPKDPGGRGPVREDSSRRG